MIDKLLKKLRIRDDISEAEADALRGAAGRGYTVPAGVTVVRRSVEQSVSLLVVEGWVVREKDLRSGDRQILEVHLPGDFVDLHSFLLKALDHDVTTLVPTTFCEFTHESLRRLDNDWPHLTRLLWFSTLLDASIQREAMLSLGRRSAIQRVAHIFCELQIRLDNVGLAQSERYPLPLSQIELSELAGMTPVHINRMLRQLREMGLATFRSGQVTIHDVDGLRDLAEFTIDYLHLIKRAR